MTDDLPLLRTVALTGAVAEHGLRRGEVGTVAEVWEPGVYEVEFSGDDGRAYAMVALQADQLMRLHFAKADVA